METTIIPVPQADRIDKVFELVKLVKDGYTVTQDLADKLGVVQRQGEYYTAAARLLGLITQDDEGVWKLTELGTTYLGVEGDEQKRKFRQYVVFRTPVFKHIGGELGVKRPNYSRHGHLFTDESFVQDAIEDLGFAPSTAFRRAMCIKTWVKEL